MRLPARRHRIDLVESRRVLVANNQVGLVAGNRTAANEQVVIDRRGQRFRQDNTALQIIDVVVDRRHQVEHARDDARGLVTQFDTHAFGSRQHVLTLQEVQRTAGTAKFLAACDGAGLCSKGVDRKLLVAELGRRFGLVVCVSAIEPAIHVGQLVVHVPDFEVAPLAEIVAIGKAHVELAHRGRKFLDGAVIAVGRIVIVCVDTAEQRLRRLVHEIAEQVLDGAFVGVGAGGQLPVIAPFAIHEERQASIQRGVVLVVGVRALQEVDRPIRLAGRQRQVRHADIEPVVFLELEIAEIQLAAAVRVQHGDFDRVRALRQNFLGHEVALRIDRNRPARYPDFLAVRNRAADADRTAAQADIVQCQRIFTIGRQQHRVAVRIERIPVLVRRLDIHVTIRNPQKLRLGFVKVAVLAIDAQDVDELLCRRTEIAGRRFPHDLALEVDVDDVERHRFERLALAEHADFAAIDEVGIIRVHAEANLAREQAAVLLPRDVDARGLRRHCETRRGPHVVETEFDIGFRQRHVSAALNVGRTAFRIVDRLAVDRDTHEIQPKRILRRQFTRHASDIHAFVIIEHGEFVIDDLHGDMRRVPLDETGVDYVGRHHVAAALELGLLGCELHFGGNHIHRTPRP